MQKICSTNPSHKLKPPWPTTPTDNMKFFAIALGLLVASVSVSAAALDTRAAEATDPFTACDGLLQGESCIWTLEGIIFTGG